MFEPASSQLAVLKFDGLALPLVEIDGVPHLAAADLGLALEMERSEDDVLDLYRRRAGEFAGGMSVRAALDTPAGPRQARLFSLLGAYAVAAFAETAAAQRFRRALLERLDEEARRQDEGLRRLVESLRRAQGETGDLRVRVEALEKALRERDELTRRLKAEFDELARALGKRRDSEERALELFLDGEFRSLSEEMDERHAAGMKALAELISAAASGTECLRTQTAAPADSTPASSAFSFDGREVRVVDIEGEIWFVAADVCAVLYIANPTRALSRLDDDEKGLHTMKVRSENGVEQDREFNIVNESGLYSLVLTSRKPQARRFKKWVTAEVLPSIRNKTDRVSGTATQIEPFAFESRQLRVEADELGNPWFCAKDVCDILGYANSRDAIAKHCKEAGVANRDVTSDVANRDVTSKARDTQRMSFISEGNLYRLIIKSNKPQAETFERWVCDEVLPSIRKTGSYRHPAASPDVQNAQPAHFPAPRPAAPLPPERRYTLDDRLYLSFQEIVRGEVRRTPQGRLTNTVSLNDAKLLAHVCRHRPESAPLARRWGELEAETGIPRRGLKRALGNLAAMGYLEPTVERRGEGIFCRIRRNEIRAALDKAGLAWPEGEAFGGPKEESA